MKIYVPRYHHSKPHSSNDVLNTMLVEVDERDLPRIVKGWAGLDQVEEANVKKYFHKATKHFCEHPVEKKTFRRFLQRPHVTVHCGAKPGNDLCQEIFGAAMFDAGYQTALHGFNFWYGGGNRGLMGHTVRGFNKGQKEVNLSDHHSIQIMPAPFVYANAPACGGRGVFNEGLCHETDAAVIMPDFMTRRELLDSKCAFAITGPGGTGSIDEFSDMIVHTKTGLRDTDVFVLNVDVPEVGIGFYDPLRAQIDMGIKCGYESPAIMDCLTFVKSAAEAFDRILAKKPEFRELTQRPDPKNVVDLDEHRLACA